MWDTSCKVRDYLVRYGDQVDRQRRHASNHANAEREGIAEIARSGQKVRIERVARNIAKHGHDSGDWTVSAVRDERIAYRDRDVFDAALDYAEAQGWVIDCARATGCASAASLRVAQISSAPLAVLPYAQGA
jgi:hypothetical protein